MRGLLLVVVLCSCRRTVVVQPDDAHVDRQAPLAAPLAAGDACDRMRATWRLREVENGTDPSLVTFEMMELDNGEMVWTTGAESPREMRMKFRVLSRTAEACRLGFQGGSTMVVRPFQPQDLELEEDGIIYRWVRVTEPIPSGK